MLNVIILADFTLEKTGIMSTAAGLLCDRGEKAFALYSDQPISLNGVAAQPYRGQCFSDPIVVFTHLEYKSLGQVVATAPGAQIHVGDWPGNYWRSLIKSGRRVRGILGLLRFRLRLCSVPKHLPLVFVSREDQLQALGFGFLNARHVPIGITAPTVPRERVINTREVCFSGNFRYEPNLLAAAALIERFNDVPDFQLTFVGYYANDLLKFSNSIEVHDNVASIVNFLAEHRPIYVSLISVGAGAKNKILEAAIAGCPIVCTEESLDASVRELESIQIVQAASDVVEKCREIGRQLVKWNDATASVSDMLVQTRSWKAMSGLMFEPLSHSNTGT